MQLAATVATTQQSSEQRFPAPHRPSDCGTAFAGRIVGNHTLVPLELVPSDIALMPVLEQNVPFGLRSAQSAPDALAAILDADLARRTAECIGASIDRVGQNVVHGGVERQLPDNPLSFAVEGIDRQIDAFITQTDMHLADTPEFSNLSDDRLSCILDALVAILLDAVASGLHVAGRNPEEPRATARLLLQRLL